MAEISYIGWQRWKKYLGGPFFGDKINLFENLKYHKIWIEYWSFGIRYLPISVTLSKVSIVRALLIEAL